MFFTHECERMHLPPKQWQGRGMTTRRQGDKVGRPLKVFSTFDGNGFVVALLLCCSVAGVAENVGNSWKQFFVVKGFKSRSRRVAQSEQALRRSAPKFFFFFLSLLFFLLLSHNEKQRAIYRVQTEREAAGGRCSLHSMYFSLPHSLCLCLWSKLTAFT